MNRLMRNPITRAAPGRPLQPVGGTPMMAPPVVLDPPPGASTTNVHCDQAIFTSIRSPMGEGYRVVGHSPGVTYDERAEITRRSPSHGSLARQEADAFGMLAYRLESGRYAVAHCIYGGTEHTARGGQRVWSHYAVLGDEAFAAFGFNPIRVQRALAMHVHPQMPPPQALEALTLPAWECADLPQSASDARDGEACVRMLDVLLRGGNWAIAGIRQPARACEWTLDLAPPVVRGDVSLSYGLGFCLNRDLRITLVDAVRTSIERMTRGQNVSMRDVTSETTLDQDFGRWYDLIRAWTPSLRWQQACRFTARVTGPLDASVLNRLADLSLDLDAAAVADDDAKAAMREKYDGFAARSPLEVELLAQLHEAIAPPPEPEEDTADSTQNTAVVINDGGRIG